MNTVNVTRAGAESCAPYGQWTRLPDLAPCSGDGWECWMTEQVCMHQPAQVALCCHDASRPLVVESMYRDPKGETLLLCGNQPMILPLALGKDAPEHLNAFMLEPGELMLLPPGVWYGDAQAADGPVYYYALLLENQRECRPLADGGVKLSL